MTHMAGALAEFELELTRERTMRHPETARRAGQHDGRKPMLKPSQKAEIVRIVEDGHRSPLHATTLLNVQATAKQVPTPSWGTSRKQHDD